MARQVEANQVVVALRAIDRGGDDADAQADIDEGLDHVGVEPVDHRTRLLARTAVRLLDDRHLVARCLPVLGEGRVALVLGLARRVVRDVEQRHVAAR